ncbi:hypothetical protein CBM2637_B110472 [Cupriavidus taiwanensis]|nr:hypothetical protein CBM2637_B110472 [Cupriavidus taiwanensis]
MRYSTKRTRPPRWQAELSDGLYVAYPFAQEADKPGRPPQPWTRQPSYSPAAEAWVRSRSGCCVNWRPGA